MVFTAREAGFDITTGLVNQIIVEGDIQVEWELSTIVNIYKGKKSCFSTNRELKMIKIDRSDSDVEGNF